VSRKYFICVLDIFNGCLGAIFGCALGILFVSWRYFIGVLVIFWVSCSYFIGVQEIFMDLMEKFDGCLRDI